MREQPTDQDLQGRAAYTLVVVAENHDQSKPDVCAVKAECKPFVNAWVVKMPKPMKAAKERVDVPAAVVEEDNVCVVKAPPSHRPYHSFLTA